MVRGGNNKQNTKNMLAIDIAQRPLEEENPVNQAEKTLSMLHV
jgi:hypothetical protein